MDRQKEDSYQIVNYYKRNRTIDMLLMESCKQKSIAEMKKVPQNLRS